MKKRFFALLCILIAITLLPSFARLSIAETEDQCGDDLCWSFDESTATLTITGSGAMWNYSESDENYAPWSEYSEVIAEIVFPDELTGVGTEAFQNCTGLTSVAIPEAAEEIGDRAFFGCVNLTTVELGENVVRIGSCAFEETALTDVQYGGTDEQREGIDIDPDNETLLNAAWHCKEPPAFDGRIEWDPEDVQFKGTTPYVIYTGSAFTPRFTVKTKDGTIVDPTAYTFEYRENTNAGTGYVFVTFGKGYSGTARAFFKIYLPATETTTVANTADGVKLTWSAVDGAAGYVIYRRAWSSTTNGWTDFVRWNNTASLEWLDTNVYAGTRYQYGIKAYFAKRTDPVIGTTIGGNVGDNYNLGLVGPLKTTVRITTRTLKSLKAGNGQITATWEPSKVFTGYQIKYATNAAFTQNVKSVWVSTPSTASTVISSLTNGKTYYVCIRSYHDFDGTRYYGQWSNALSAAPVAPTKYRALLVGEVNFNWGYMETANRNGGDVEHMATMLQSVKGPSGASYQITKKTNLNRSKLESAIKTAFSETTDQDVSLFFIATHGDSSDEGQLVLTDGSNYPYFLSFGELASMLSKYVKGDVIVIIESCGAGSAIYKNGKQIDDFDPSLLTQQAIAAFAELDRGETPNTGELRRSRYYVLAAAKHQQDSWGHELEPAGNYFTDWLVEGVGTSGAMPADTNNDKVVTLNELYTYISQYDTFVLAGYATQQVQVYPENSSYKLFKR